MNLFLSIALPSLAVGLAVGMWLGVFVASTSFTKQDKELRADVEARLRAIDAPDLFDEQHAGFGNRSRFDFGASSDYPLPPRPTSEFDGEGRHASSAPLFSQRPLV